MKKTLLLLLIVFNDSCTEKIHFIREGYRINKKVFYGLDGQAKETADFSFFKHRVDKAFALSPIEKSTYPYELRVYFVYSFGETFLLQQFDEKDSMMAQLITARTEVINDSLFMDHKELVTIRGNYKYDGSFKIKGLKTDSLLIENDVPPNTLDHISLFYFQIKIKNSVKYIIADAIDFRQSRDVELSIVKKITQLEKDLDFEFISKRILDSAFLNPYNLH